MSEKPQNNSPHSDPHRQPDERSGEFHTLELPDGFIYGYMHGVPLRRPPPLMSPEETKEIFRDVAPEKLERFDPEQLCRIAYTAYVMAETQVHLRTPLASLGIMELTKLFAIKDLDQVPSRPA